MLNLHIMLKKLYSFLISTPLMGGLILMLAVAMGAATFIENDFGASAAKSLVYNSWWFELIFLLLAINLFGNIIRYRLWSLKHFPVLLFHLSFFIIIAGSAVTRYIGYEGMMHIREGNASDVIYSADDYLTVTVKEGENLESSVQKVFFSPVTPNEFSARFSDGVKVKSIAFVPKAMLQPVEKAGGDPYLTLMAMSMSGSSTQTLGKGDVANFASVKLGFEPHDTTGVAFLIRQTPEGLVYSSQHQVLMVEMKTGVVDTFAVGGEYVLQPGMVYSVADARILVKAFMPSAVLKPVYQPDAPQGSLPTAIVLSVKKGKESKELVIRGMSGEPGTPSSIKIGNKLISAEYGAIPMKLPFSLHLNKFILERYPGSHSPSSFTSEVTLNDPGHNLKEDKRIFMNNILNYRGYRFYQSSYDTDEKGTVLSVNHDGLGTLLTYIGYFLMSLGMFLALIMPGTRFRNLYKQAGDLVAKKKSMMTLLALMLSISAFAQDIKPPHSISKEQARQFGLIWVQDNDGRMKPLNTMNNEVARKLVKHNSFHGMNEDQMALSMLVDREFWQTVPVITIANGQLREILGVTLKKASFSQFFDKQGNYIMSNYVDEAYRKKPSVRNKFDQEVIKVDEQVNVFYMAQTGRFLRIFPDPSDSHAPWITPGDAPKGFATEDSVFVRNIIPLYLNALMTDKSAEAQEYLASIAKYQDKYAHTILPGEGAKNMEALYNRTNIFLMLSMVLFILGAVLVVFQFVTLLKPIWKFVWINRLGFILMVAGFALYTAGLGVRWYISGHAPWSNGYESMLYIGWSTLLAGLVFSKRSPIAMSASSLFAGLVLMVAHLSWMNPEITNLVPVLKSYWLTIHVAVIVASYGFLGLGALLGMLNLVLLILKTPRNQKLLSVTISELSVINEMSLTVGLYLLTIGSLLGGVWANESWGRYWGWDPKETWSAVTIFIYAFVLHMRLIPGMKSTYSFNLMSLISFGSVVMTYLGVNYYLAGLHSYAKGDPLPIPASVYYSVAFVTILAFVAYYRERQFEKKGIKQE